MRVITLLNEKGGVGKTTLAVHLATGLAVRGHRVILIDADPQANASANLGIADQPMLHDLLVRDADWQDALVVVSPEVYEIPGEAVQGHLMLVPGHVETRVISQLVDDPYVFMDKVEVLRGSVDYVIVDTSPTPSLLHGAIYMGSDALVYPTHLEYLSFMGLVKSIQHRQNTDKRRQSAGLKSLHILGIVPTMYRGNTIEHSENLADLKQRFGDKVWEPIHLRTVWAEASRVHKPVWGVMPNGKAAKEAWRFVKRFEHEVQHVGK